MRNKRGVINFLVGLILIMGFVVHGNQLAFGEEVVGNKQEMKANVEVNGKLLEFPDAKPFIDENSRTLVPIRFIAEALGKACSEENNEKEFSESEISFNWDGETSTALIMTEDKVIKIPINKPYAYVGDVKVELDTKAIIKESRTFIPLRFVAESFGAKVSWINETSTAKIQLESSTATTSNPKVDHLTFDVPMSYFKERYVAKTFDFVDGRLKMKSNFSKDDKYNYFEPKFMSTDYMPHIDHMMYSFLKKTASKDRYTVVEYFDDADRHGNEDKVIMTFAKDYKYYYTHNYYYAFYMFENGYFDAADCYMDDKFSDHASMRLNLKSLKEVNGEDRSIQKGIRDPLYNAIVEMFSIYGQGELIADYVMSKYDNWDRETDHQTFGSIQVDYYKGNGFDFFFTFN